MIKNTLLRLAVAGIAGLLIACGGNEKESAENEAAVKVLRFSAIPDEDTTAQKERFQPVADYLSKALGIDVEFVPSINYGASVEKFENNDVQLAWFGGVTGVQAMSRVPGARALVAGQKDLAFKSYFIANASTGLEASEDFPTAIADLKFTYGSSSSTSGCIMPSHFIIENTGKTPMEFFKEKPGFSGAHDKTAMLVQDGSFQAGALSFGTYEKLVAAGKVDPAKCVKIWETPTYADYNMTAHPDLENAFGEGFLDKLQQALVDCQDEAALKALGREKLVKVNNETFAGIAAVMEKVSFD
ncbi:MAG: putative selenate ABC transporter substrate-binding protein [Euryarchaeota archaeon]|nr:putative selenate ABC transporter substrate-binding protein [Euryarchaeota archaeon]